MFLPADEVVEQKRLKNLLCSYIHTIRNVASKSYSNDIEWECVFKTYYTTSKLGSAFLR
jgi:hypothetical protein